MHATAGCVGAQRAHDDMATPTSRVAWGTGSSCGISRVARFAMARALPAFGPILAIGAGMDTLRIGRPFPDLEVRITDGGVLRLPEAARGFTSVLVFYRGHW